MAKNDKVAAVGSNAPSAESEDRGFASVLKSGQMILQSSQIISRNKHWHYISAYHGSWVKVAPEVLEEMARANADCALPRPVDAAVFFDICKVKRLIDDATNLAVRAFTGIGIGSNTDIHTLHGTVVVNNNKLSKERKYHVRKQATQILSEAYRVDEIAASVGTILATTSLEDVAKQVLQKSPENVDANYVHFFHEKIPPKEFITHTHIESLDKIVAEKPKDAALLRTRGVTKMFLADYHGAVRDLSDALSICRHAAAQHNNTEEELRLLSLSVGQNQAENRLPKEWTEKNMPTGLEQQILFNRAGAYLSLACHFIKEALSESTESKESVLNAEEKHTKPRAAMLEARKSVKMHAKRALRDYLSFLSKLTYSPGLDPETIAECKRRIAVIRREKDRSVTTIKTEESIPTSKFVEELKGPEIFLVSSLFSAGAPQPEMNAWVSTRCKEPGMRFDPVFQKLVDLSQCPESTTFHPLAMDALHSVLLCHCLMQTSIKELRRHAEWVARLCRITDRYPLFMRARSRSRGDWVDILRETGNWIDLPDSWENLCDPELDYAEKRGVKARQDTPEQAKERLYKDAILDALSDERVQDKKTFDHVVAHSVSLRSQSGLTPTTEERREEDKRLLFRTKRAEHIVSWINQNISPAKGPSRPPKDEN